MHIKGNIKNFQNIFNQHLIKQKKNIIWIDTLWSLIYKNVLKLDYCDSMLFKSKI